MMSVNVGRGRVASLFSNNSSPLFKFHVHFSLSVNYFSTSSEAEPPVTTLASTLQKYEFSPEVISRALALFKTPRRSDFVLSYLKEFGFSNTQLEKIVKCKPELLNANIDNRIRPKIKIFQDLGFSPHEIAEIISKNPDILARSISNRIIPSLSVLQGLMRSTSEVSRLLRINSWFLIRDLEKTMIPNIEFLKSCGIPAQQITRHIFFFPRFILYKPEVIRKSVNKADEMGVSRNSHFFIYAVKVVTSLSNENLELKMKTFRDFGFSEDEIVGIFRKAPQVFAVSQEKIKNVIKLLLETGKYSTLCIVRYPKSLMYSIETRYKPRLHALATLEKQKLIESWPSLAMICKTSNEKFFAKYVDPYTHGKNAFSSR